MDQVLLVYAGDAKICTLSSRRYFGGRDAYNLWILTKSTTKATANASGTTSRQLLREKRLPFLHLSLHQRHAEHNRALASAAAPTTRHMKPYVTLEPSMPQDLPAGDGSANRVLREQRALRAACSASRGLRVQRPPRREQSAPRAACSPSGVLGELLDPRDPRAVFSASHLPHAQRAPRAACSASCGIRKQRSLRAACACEQLALRAACSSSSVLFEQRDPPAACSASSVIRG